MSEQVQPATIEPAPINQTVPRPLRFVAEPFAIGSVGLPSRFFLAPLAGYTSMAYRLAVREIGGLGMATTDLVNARSIIERRPRSRELAETCPADQPLAIQIYGQVAAEMREAARWVVDQGASIVDINMGCPVRKVVRSGGGSALMCDPSSASALVEHVVTGVSVPVTVKMRLGWDEANLSAPRLAREFENVGVAAVIVHGRTRAQGFGGLVSRDGIRAVVEAVDTMPIVGNGDIRTIAEADAMFRETGCSAVSIGRGALANPFFFRELVHWARTGELARPATFEERVDVMERHFRLLVERRGARLACLQFRKLTKWYFHLICPARSIYLKMINLNALETFDQAVAEIRSADPARPLPSRFDPKIPVPSGPIDKW